MSRIYLHQTTDCIGQQICLGDIVAFPHNDGILVGKIDVIWMQYKHGVINIVINSESGDTQFTKCKLSVMLVETQVNEFKMKHPERFI